MKIDSPFGITAGDFNEDGKADLVITSVGSVYTFLGNGDGTFTPAASSPRRVPSPPYDDFPSPYAGTLAVGDFNNSGHLGLAIAEINNEAEVILLGNGDGTFFTSSAAFVAVPGFPVQVVNAADFNGDGNLDLITAAEFSYVAPVVLGYGRGAFNAAGNLYNSGGLAMGAAIGDFDGDGKLDGAVASGALAQGQISGVSVSLGKGDGTFTLANGSPLYVGTSLSAIVTADFNGDGKLDIAVTDSGGNAVLILLGKGDGSFGAPSTIAVGTQPEAIVAGDFNNDGKLDLAITNAGDGTITLLLGNGDGTFTEASGSPYAVGGNPYWITAADFNGDGKLDLATANLMDGTISILLQQ